MGKYQFQSRTPYYGIGYEEMPRSPKFGFQRGTGMYATRILRCNWSDANALCRELLGVIEFVAGVPNFVNPLTAPGLQYLIVNQIDVEPFDGDSPDGDTELTLGTTASTYEGVGAMVTAQYKTMDLNQDQNRPNIPDGTYLSIRETLGVEYQTLPGRTWVWTSNSQPLPDDVAAGMIIPTGQIVANWSRVAQPPDITVENARGKVNTSTFIGRAAGTVLFLGMNKNRQFQFDDSNSGLYDLEYSFSINNKGWNKFYDPARGDWFTIKATIGGAPPYASTSFDQLFGYNG
ncbi:MAG TPA: hypothetical protein VGN12_27425 [Pirellulales bacterium]|jgi:hypothetical protein